MDDLISVSILNADLLHLEDEVRRIGDSGADMLHFDVMDGIFVPNISFGLPVLQAISGTTSLFRDVHLMISHPLPYIRRFADAGADLITFHLESEDDPFRTLAAIREAGCQAGLSIKPGTPASTVKPFLDMLDYVLVMTVEPGFGGQSYMHDMTAKIAEIRRMTGDRKIRVEVDGGINAETSQLALQAGADVLVAGSYLFGQEDMRTAVQSLRRGGVQ